MIEKAIDWLIIFALFLDMWRQQGFKIAWKELVIYWGEK